MEPKLLEPLLPKDNCASATAIVIRAPYLASARQVAQISPISFVWLFLRGQLYDDELRCKMKLTSIPELKIYLLGLLSN